MVRINKKEMERNREEGIARAEKAAGKKWREEAIAFIRGYPNPTSFRTEEIRDWAEGAGLRKPKSVHVWGSLTRSLKSAGVIKLIGDDKTQSVTCHASTVGLYVMVR